MSILGTRIIVGGPSNGLRPAQRARPGVDQGARHSWVIQLEVGFKFPEWEVAGGSGKWEGNALLGLE